jgi:hypothetical protein
MGRLLTACTGLAAELTAAGVPASVERAKVRTPGAWISPQTRDVTRLDGSGTAQVDVILVVGDHGEATALAALDDLLDKVLGISPPLAVTEPVDTAYALTLTASPLPAFRVPVELDL